MAKENTSAAEQNLQEQIEQLRKEIGNIANTLSAIGAERLNKAKGKAEAFYSNAREHGEEALKDARHKLHSTEQSIGKCIKEKPIESLAVAAAAGFILALVLRR